MSELPGRADMPTQLKLYRGAVRYTEHLVSAGAVPHYVIRGATGWIRKFGEYMVLYDSYVKPCLDANGVVAQDRAFWTAWSYKLFKALISSPTALSLPRDVLVSYVGGVMQEALRVAERVNPNVANCIGETLGVIAPSPVGEGGEATQGG